MVRNSNNRLEFALFNLDSVFSKVHPFHISFLNTSIRYVLDFFEQKISSLHVVLNLDYVLKRQET
jgi:hypothetical protein